MLEKSGSKSCCYIIPCYNNSIGLNRTIDSIRRSDHSDVDIMVYDDGSVPAITVQCGSGVHLFRNEKNKGTSSALNFLIMEAKIRGYEFCALIDAGDHVLPDRLTVQLDYMRTNSDCIVLGGGAVIKNIDDDKCIVFQPPSNPLLLERAFKRGYPFVHPTAFYRLSKINTDRLYNTKYRAAVDYEFLYGIFSENLKAIHNLDKILIEYIREPNSIGVKRSRRQAQLTLCVRWKNIKKLDYDTIFGLIQPSIVIRALSPKLFFWLSSYYQKIKSRL